MPAKALSLTPQQPDTQESQSADTQETQSADKQVSFTVSFDANSSQGTNIEAPQAQSAAQGSSITLPSLNLDGYEFEGWSDVADYTSLTSVDRESHLFRAETSYTPSNDITLYAVWAETEDNASLNTDSNTVADTNNLVNPDDTNADNEITEVSTWDSLANALSTTETAEIKLAGNIKYASETTTTLTLNGEKTLDLNGNVLAGTRDDDVITMSSNSKLTLQDSNSSNYHYYTYYGQDDSKQKSWVLNDETEQRESAITIDEISIKDNPTPDGTIIKVEGGVITGGRRGITVASGANLTMSSGNLIANNTGSKYTLHKDCTGGGIHIFASGNLILNGGRIVGNYAAFYSTSGYCECGGGGGIQIDYNASATLNGGCVSCNNEGTGGGGISQRGTLKIPKGSGVKIQKNWSRGTAGILICSKSTLTELYGGEITGNITNGTYAGGVRVWDSDQRPSDPTVYVGGDLVVKDNYRKGGNTLSNIWLSALSSSVTSMPKLIVGKEDETKPVEGAYFGIFTQITPGGTVSEVQITTNGGKDYLKYFQSDEGWKKKFNEKDEVWFTNEKAKPIADCKISPVDSKVYTSKEIRPSVEITYGGTQLVQGPDYTLSYTKNVDVSKEAIINILGQGDYSGSISTTFEITKATPIVTISKCDDVLYGTAPSPEAKATIKASDTETVEVGTVMYSYSNKESGPYSAWDTENMPGTYWVKAYVEEENNWFSAYSTQQFSVTKPTVIFVEKPKDEVYTGKEFKPNLTVTNENGIKLTTDKYSATYTNNINVGEAKVNVTGLKGYAECSVETSFKINKATPVISDFACADVKYGETPAPSAKTTFGVSGEPTFTYSDSQGGTYGEWSTKNSPGSYWVKASVADNDNWNPAEETNEFKVNKSSDSISIQNIDPQTYTGNEITPTLIVKDAKGDVVSSENYTATYTNNINVSDTPVVTVTGKNGYTGLTATATFKINKATPVISPFTCSDVVYGNTPTPSATSTFGSATFSYSNEESGTYGDWNTENPVQTYWVKAYVEPSDNWNSAVSKLTFKVNKRPLTLISSSAFKIYDGTALTSESVIVGGQGFANDESVSYAFGANRVDVGVTSNSFTITWDKASESNYEVEKVFGALEVKPTQDSEVKVDTEALKEIEHEYQDAHPADTITVDLEISKEKLRYADIEKIQQAVGDKKVEGLDVELIVKINGVKQEDAGSTNDKLIAATYKFDFANKEDIQIYRVHADGNPEELTETPNKNDEFATYDTSANTVTTTAKKYSTYSVVYNVPSDPTPANESTSSQTFDPAGSLCLGAFGAFAAAAAVVLIARRRAHKN